MKKKPIPKKYQNKKPKISKGLDKSSKSSHRVVPLGDRVLLRPLSAEEVNTTVSGIIIPETVSKEKPEQGIVLAVGRGKTIDGKLVPVEVEVGQRVVFSRYGYDEVKVDGEELYILKEENILAVIN